MNRRRSSRLEYRDSPSTNPSIADVKLATAVFVSDCEKSSRSGNSQMRTPQSCTVASQRPFGEMQDESARASLPNGGPKSSTGLEARFISHNLAAGAERI